MTTAAYTQTYKWLAIWEHILRGIPASITLAQGSLESNNGTSYLATKANNHFGIKAYSNPAGLPVIYANDDTTGEPFRKYDSPQGSYIDHSIFLQSNPRYSSLFDSSDFNTWADGLKAAGYATSPTYAETLKNIIKDNDLEKYDWYGKNKYWILAGIIFAFLLFLYLLYRAIHKN